MQRILMFISLAACIVLGFVFSKTTPSDIPPVGILVVFVCLYIVVLTATMIVLQLGSHLVATVIRSIKPLSSRATYLYASMLAIAPVILIALQSVVGVSSLDVLLVIAFEAVACFYVWRRL